MRNETKNKTQYQNGFDQGWKSWSAGVKYVHPSAYGRNARWRDGFAAGWHEHEKESVGAGTK